MLVGTRLFGGCDRQLGDANQPNGLGLRAVGLVKVVRRPCILCLCQKKMGGWKGVDDESVLAHLSQLDLPFPFLFAPQLFQRQVPVASSDENRDSSTWERCTSCWGDSASVHHSLGPLWDPKCATETRNAKTSPLPFLSCTSPPAFLRFYGMRWGKT